MNTHFAFLTLASPIYIPLETMAASTAEEPLLANQPEEDTYGDEVDEDISHLLEKNLRKPGLFVWLLTFSAGISGLLFGCRNIPTFYTYSHLILTHLNRRHRCHILHSHKSAYLPRTTPDHPRQISDNLLHLVVRPSHLPPLRYPSLLSRS